MARQSRASSRSADLGWTLLILLAALTAGQARLGMAQTGESTSSRWQPPPAEQVPELNEEAKTAPRVRIGLRLTSFNKVVTRTGKGEPETKFVPGQTLRHTLRARLDRMNHFFVGDYHIETKPLSFIRKARRYKVRLNLYKRYGAFGQLEESLGHVDLEGVLEEQERNVHVLFGATSKRIRDKFGNPVVDVVAGFRPGETKQAMATTPSMPNVTPKNPPQTSSGPLIRGRF